MSAITVVPFFFQAEDGIRDKLVTGVQTCALPISPVQVTSPSRRRFAEALRTRDRTASSIGSEGLVCPPIEPTSALMTESVTLLMAGLLVQIAGSLYIP